MKRMILGFVSGLAAMAMVALPASAEGVMADVQADLDAAHLSVAGTRLQARLEEVPSDDQARFALGTVQFLAAVENLGQGLYRYGLNSGSGSHSRSSMIPALQIPVPVNPKPEEISYDRFQDLLRNFTAELEAAEMTLAAIKDETVVLPLDLAAIRLDLDGDGAGGADEGLIVLFERFGWRLPADQRNTALGVDFDWGDVAWLQGYCHLLQAIADVTLAYDWHEAFDVTFPSYFPMPSSPNAQLGHSAESFSDILDIVAFIHLIRWQMVDRERLLAVQQHFLSVVALSRESWKRIGAETDNGREWIPNPQQSAAIAGARVTAETIEGWQLFLADFEALLQGRKLLPHIRLQAGLNLDRFFKESESFDLVLMIQGSAALPYMEQGEMATSRSWDRMVALMGGNFLRTAAWFN